MEESNVKFSEYLKELSFSDLYYLFTFISADYNKQFGDKVKARQWVQKRYSLVLEEINNRAYDGNPYYLDAVKVNGEKPENIDLSKFEDK